MSYQDRYKGRRIKDPPNFLGRFGLFILVGAAFAAFVGCLRGLDSSLCALATLCVVTCKLLVELIATKAKFKMPERFAKLPLAIWLLFWLLPIPPLWFVLRTIWPKNADPNGIIGFLTLVCVGLYIPTMMAVVQAGEQKPEAVKEDDGADQIEKVDFNVDFNAAADGKSETKSDDESEEKTGKAKNKAKRKRKK